MAAFAAFEVVLVVAFAEIEAGPEGASAEWEAGQVEVLAALGVAPGLASAGLVVVLVAAFALLAVADLPVVQKVAAVVHHSEHCYMLILLEWPI